MALDLGTIELSDKDLGIVEETEIVEELPEDFKQLQKSIRDLGEYKILLDNLEVRVKDAETAVKFRKFISDVYTQIYSQFMEHAVYKKHASKE